MLEGGYHLILDLETCDALVLNSTEGMKQMCHDLAEVMGTQVVNSAAHQFFPQGVTAFAIISESHISIHTWPEARKAFVDVFTCQEYFDKDRVVAFVSRRLGAQQIRTTLLLRNGAQSCALFAGELEDGAKRF